MAKKEKRPLTNEEKLLIKYQKKLKWEAITKSLIVGFVFGFAICVPVTVISFITSFNPIWVCIGLLAGGTIGFSFFTYFKYYRTDMKKVATRVDGVGLEERVVTMLECSGRDDALARRQREDAGEVIAKVDPKQVKFRLPKLLFVVIGVCAALSIVMIVMSTWNANRVAEAEEAKRQEQQEDPVLSEEDQIIADMIAELRREIDEARIRDSLKEDLHGIVDDLEKNLRPTDTKEVKIAKISETAQRIHDLIQQELSRYVISNELKKHDTTKDMGAAIEAADMNAIKESTEALYGVIEPSIDSGSFDTLIQTAGDLVQSLIDAGYDVDEGLQESIIAAGYPLKTKTKAAANFKPRSAALRNAKGAATVPDNDALAEALEKLAQDLMDALPQPDDPGFDKDMIKDDVDQAIQDAVESITGAVQDQVDQEQADDELQDTISDALDQLGQPTPETPDDPDDPPEEEENNPSHKDPLTGDIVYDSVIDGKTPYMDVYDEYYQKALELLTSGTLTDEERQIIENYFNILN